MPPLNAVSVASSSAWLSEGVLPVKRPGFLSKFAYYCLPFRRRTTLRNMTLVFGGTLSSAQIRYLAQSTYGHFLRSCWENLLMGVRSKRWLKEQVCVVGTEHVLKASEGNKGILLLTGHFGNWEFAPVGGMHRFRQFKGRFHVLRRHLVNKFVERLVFRRFYEAGLDVIPKKNSLGKVLNHLANNDVVAFIMDQHAKPGKDGVVVNFFGKSSGTFKSLAVVARTTGAPVIPSYSYRAENGTHVMKFLEPLCWIEHPDPDTEILENTRVYNEVLERIILEHPEQWWWVHRRWKV